MKALNKKKIFVISGVVLALAIIVGLIIFNENRLQNIKDNADEWKSTAIVTPEAGSLKPGGYITISWNPADTMGSVKEYEIYINDELVETVDNKITTYEYYSTSVSEHKLYIKAKLYLGSEINSDITTFFVNKKGFCVNKEMAVSLDATEWGTSWYYNWSVNKFNFDSFQDMEYVPMVWGRASTDRKTISRFSKWNQKYVLAYNEPDLAGQADMEIEDAVEGMADFMDQNLLVGSPATALCPPWSDEWFQPFMERVDEEGIKIDFIAIHHYWNWYQEEGAYAFLELVDETYEMYGKPIWITEFSISGVPVEAEKEYDAVYNYMNIVLPELDKREYVERYAWFPFSNMSYQNGGSALYQYFTGEVYKLGELYQDLGMPEGYDVNNKIENVKNTELDIIK